MPKFNGSFKFVSGNVGTKESPIPGIKLAPGGDLDQTDLRKRLEALVAATKASDKIRVFDPDNKLSNGPIKTIRQIAKALESGDGYAFVVMQGRAARPAPYLAFLRVNSAPASTEKKAKTPSPLEGI